MLNKDIKIKTICQTIKSRISDINKFYRHGPDLYFYKRVFHLRQSTNITDFLNIDYNIEILYATLVSWDMNTRGAKMKYYDEFKTCLIENLENFKIIEILGNNRLNNKSILLSKLGEIYDNLNFMRTNGRLVSNSKVLHFLFPKFLMPMDRSNTLYFFYNNTNESKSKYLEIMDICLEIMGIRYNWNRHLDNKWNVTVPKMIDNAILLLVGKSIKKTTVHNTAYK
ncbi:MAG: hypothetical protein JXA68_08725 [Ignavibacteriales bacterium]|nr:hypothetical protein [Ignavibacteriales bacterium]